jgi:hypothetical protein
MGALHHQIKLPTSIYPANVLEDASLTWKSFCNVTIVDRGDFVAVQISLDSDQNENTLHTSVAEFLNYALDASIKHYLSKQTEEV